MNLNDLNSSLATFTPCKSPNCKNPVILETLKNGLLSTCEQLGYAYINTYDSMSITWVSESDPDRKHCAKICMTTFPVLYNALAELKQGLEKSEKSWQLYTMYNSGNMDSSLRKLFFGENGYDVGRPATSPYGELNHKSTFDGSNVLANLSNKTHNLFSPGHARLAGALSSGAHIIPVEYADEDGLIPDLYALLKPYAQVCHLSTFSSTKSPCSVFEMLLWCSGLQFNGVYDKLCDYCDSLFDKVADNADPEHKILAPIAAYPKAISAFDVSAAIEHIVSRSYQLLTAVLGTGNAYTMYACDFPINTLGLKYPTSGADCLDMLLDVLRRLCPVLHYLYRQCNITANYGGWRDCWYGKDIKTSKWPCKVHPTDVSNNERMCQANYQPNCQSNCQATSPLMSYLHDSLPGHLPHDISSIGCRAVCSTCPKVKKGMPCLTPLGFRGFTGSVKTGRELCEILRDFFANSYITTLFGLMPRPPTSLPEHFEFALQLANVLNNDGSGREAVSAAFVKSTKDQSIDLYNEPSKLTIALCNAYNSNKRHDGMEHPNVSDADLSTLSKETTCNYPNKNIHCAPYLSTLYSDYYYYAAEKHTALYLSWALYSAWTLYEYLKSLLDAFGNISCQDWGCDKCQHGGKCKPGRHGLNYNCRCKGLVECRGVRSIFYAYGFTFGNAEVLSDFENKRYCHNFYKQLQNVLNSKCFIDLFQKCDEFIFTIRQPFIWLNIALWSLSLFYLICVMVGRLDVFHIRSHLRSPSSHTITAQSLLAAAQVGRLAKITYLQP
ncbi:hypothetical protein, conserved [Babesia bigemina]|uniref:Uncharacterized protein n=1 Tax=Babesia bigemina TaxID=5866 RepID=A0A061BS87_BABBI|nr:hypothetical protein, conserved [Babesia bigemina]CDR71416.1 hypothetical protein, conserved [Babesia bigemina]|eukprot:XP_012770366.1 hypothetical protein, conserved [Babesia bigemina]